jgi:hypothetical protein
MLAASTVYHVHELIMTGLMARASLSDITNVLNRPSDSTQGINENIIFLKSFLFICLLLDLIYMFQFIRTGLKISRVLDNQSTPSNCNQSKNN